MRRILSFLSIAVLVTFAVTACSSASSRPLKPSSSKSPSAAGDSCDRYYEAKAFGACKAGNVAEAKQLEADYENGTGSYSPPPARQYGVGDTISSGGATLTLLSFGQVPSVRVNESNYLQGSGYESYTDHAPDAGSALYQLMATVKNDGKSAMDLTCSLGVDIQLLSSQNEKYDPIDDLYKVKGNPECNHFMQPGYSENMTWVFQAPSDRHIVGAIFTEPFNTQSAPGIFTLDKGYTLSQSNAN